LGLVINELCGAKMMKRHHAIQLFQLFLENRERLRSVATPDIAAGSDASLRAIIEQFIKPHYEDRMTAEHFFNHSYIRQKVQKSFVLVRSQSCTYVEHLTVAFLSPYFSSWLHFVSRCARL